MPVNVNNRFTCSAMNSCCSLLPEDELWNRSFFEELVEVELPIDSREVIYDRRALTVTVLQAVQDDTEGMLVTCWT